MDGDVGLPSSRKVEGTPLLKKGRGDSGLVISSHDRKGASCKWMNGTREGNSCRVEVGYRV